MQGRPQPAPELKREGKKQQYSVRDWQSLIYYHMPDLKEFVNPPGLTKKSPPKPIVFHKPGSNSQMVELKQNVPFDRNLWASILLEFIALDLLSVVGLLKQLETDNSPEEQRATLQLIVELCDNLSARYAEIPVDKIRSSILTPLRVQAQAEIDKRMQAALPTEAEIRSILMQSGSGSSHQKQSVFAGVTSFLGQFSMYNKWKSFATAPTTPPASMSLPGLSRKNGGGTQE